MVLLQVRLNSEAAAFLAGEQVSGEVTAHVDSPTKARRICVEVFGHAYNRWFSHENHLCTAEAQLINVIVVLWKPPCGDVGVIEEGNYCFPFSFVIPPNALPSHRSHFGRIDYWCKAKVDRPSTADDETTLPFVVANVVDLNAIISPPNPVRKCLDMHVGCLGGNGVLSAEVSMDKFGYAGGEVMLLCIDVDNASNESVRTIRIRVSEEWFYQGYIATKGQRDTRCLPGWLLSLEDGLVVAPKDRGRYQRRIKLPALQPSYGCKIIVHSFNVQVSISTDGACSSSLWGQLPFYVGTVPLRGAEAVSDNGQSADIPEELRNAAIRDVVKMSTTRAACEY